MLHHNVLPSATLLRCRLLRRAVLPSCVVAVHRSCSVAAVSRRHAAAATTTVLILLQLLLLLLCCPETYTYLSFCVFLSFYIELPVV
jgi:hypothetical protein